MNATKVAGIVGIGVAINAVSVAREHDAAKAMSTIFAGVGLFAGLTGIGEYIDWSLATTLAVVYLLGTMLTRGVGFIDWFNSLVKGL